MCSVRFGGGSSFASRDYRQQPQDKRGGGGGGRQGGGSYYGSSSGSNYGGSYGGSYQSKSSTHDWWENWTSSLSMISQIYQPTYIWKRGLQAYFRFCVSLFVLASNCLLRGSVVILFQPYRNYSVLLIWMFLCTAGLYLNSLWN